ncbi:MAG: rod-binding protein [Alphaproteobacteria bacterium]|nr:rod-binding protein [Alphaproteobacteria bacterium]
MEAPGPVRTILPPLPLQGPSPLPEAQMADLRRAAQDFEAMVLRELLGPMFEALDTEGLGGGGAGERMFRPMLVGEYAGGMADRGGIGLADYVLAELIRLQAQGPAPQQQGE